MYAVCEILFFICPFFFLGLVQYDCTKTQILKETYVSPVEKSIKVLIKSTRLFDREFVTIKDNSEELLYNLPFPENIKKKNNSTISATFNPFKNKIKAIFPGVYVPVLIFYWCGDGNISSNERDLGLFEKIDACCRLHDLCPNNIPAEAVKGGLLNNGIFTRSTCECDGDFYRCLKEVNNIVATNIGAVYFNILRPQCFQKYYPIQSCAKYSRQRLIDNKCEEYDYNVMKPKTMQWFDNPDF